jgi:hypothetical protein
MGEIQAPSDKDPPDLRGLLCGRNPEIFRAPAPAKTAPEAVKTRGFPMTVPTFDTMSPRRGDNAPKPGSRLLASQSENYQVFLDALQNSREASEKWTHRLESYDQSRRRRAAQISSDFSEKYASPLLQRLSLSMKDKYEKYLSKKRGMLKLVDAADVPVHSARDIPSPPCISVSTRGLKDPTAKYSVARDEEESIEAMLSREIGQDVIPKRKALIPLKDPRAFDFGKVTKLYDDERPRGRKVIPDCIARSDHLAEEWREF